MLKRVRRYAVGERHQRGAVKLAFLDDLDVLDVLLLLEGLLVQRMFVEMLARVVGAD